MKKENPTTIVAMTVLLVMFFGIILPESNREHPEVGLAQLGAFIMIFVVFMGFSDES